MSQVGYGHSDPVGMPFDFYSGAVGVAAATPYTMASASLVLQPAAAVTIGTITLPLNPPDGCVAEISNVGSGGAITLAGTAVAANSGDTLVNGTLGAPTTITPAAATTGSATATLRYKYTLNGYVVGNSQVPGSPALSARTWFRVA